MNIYIPYPGKYLVIKKNNRTSSSSLSQEISQLGILYFTVLHPAVTYGMYIFF